MPQPVKTEKRPEDDIQIIAPEPKPQQKPEPKIEVDETGKPVGERVPEPSVSAEEFRKLQARMEYQSRQNEKLTQSLQETLARLNQSPQRPPAEKPAQTDEFGPDLDAIAQADWKKGVSVVAEKIAEKKFKAYMEERDKVQKEESFKQSQIMQLEREKSWVLERTPSLTDETSDEFKAYYATYNRMLGEDPNLAMNPRAPRLVWYEMQESVRDKDRTPEAKESERLKRVAAGASPQGRPLTTKKTFQLTQAELDMCNERGLSPAVYAQAKEADLKEGLSA